MNRVGDKATIRRAIGAILQRAAAAVLALALLASGALAAERVVLRAGEHKGFSRLVFDWATRVDYKASLEGDRLVITFSRLAELDLVEVAGGALSRVSDPQVGEEADKLVLRFKVHPEAAVRNFRDGAKVVIDIADPASASPQELQEKKKPQPAPARKQKQPSQTVRKPVAKAPPTETAGEPMPEAKAASSKLAYTGAPVSLQYEPIFNGLRLTYPLGDVLPGAVFVRAGHLWVVFEKYRPVDQGALSGVLGERIKSAEQLANPIATVLRYRIAGGQNAAAHRRGATWIVELKDNKTSPQIPIDIAGQEVAGKPSVFLPITDVGSRIDIDDPLVGDRLSVVPVIPSGRGVQETRRFAQFQIAATAQGIVVEVNADDVEVNRYRNGVAITAPDGLALSGSVIAAVEQPDPNDDESALPQRLVDFKAWRRGEIADYMAIRHGLLYRLSQSNAEERNSVRWDLARFYLGHGLPDQALGILQVMQSSDQDLLSNAEFRAIRGISFALLRRFEEARNDLSFSALDSEVDIYLWRALAAEGLGDGEGALAAFERGADILPKYDDAERGRFYLVAARAALETGQYDIMENVASVLTGLMLPADASIEAEYLRAKLLIAKKQPKVAREALKKVIASGGRGSAARAKLAEIELKLDKNEMAPQDAIDQLERLRFAWRGDDFELNLLDRLGRLYITVGDYRTGLNTLRQAVTYFDKTPRTRKLSDLMTAAFRDLFMAGKADAMPPLEALSLYYDFRELTPLGADGDNMIRRLADRLVSVDLLERAAALLEHQVRYRLEGVAQADVAVRLAMIYLLDHKPEKALAVIRATRQTIMPEDVEARRRRLEARALIDLARYEEAEVLLEGDKSRDADLLRADLFWGGGRWPEVVANAEKLLGRRWEEKRALSNDERRQVLRIAVAMSLAENAEGLRGLRERYAGPMTDGAYATAFSVITAKQDTTAKEIKELTESIASVNTLEGFMSAYRKEFKGS